MNIVLAAINAKYIHSNLAIYSLRAGAGEFRSRIQLREYTINQKEDEILKDIWKSRPDLLFFSCYIWNISFVRNITRDIRQIFPGLPVWLGGPEVSYDAEDFLRKNPQITGVIKGEGEETFREILQFYHGEGCSGGLSDIPGIAWREKDAVRSAPWRDAADFDALPFPYEEMEVMRHRIVYYESSRGCPFSCCYCLSSVDKRLRFRNPERVKRELQFFLDREVPQVKFVDRTFNCNRRHAMEIWRFIRDHDTGKTNFHFEIAADLLEDEEIALLNSLRPGLVQLEIGVQSTNPQTLAAIRRKMDFEKVSLRVRQIQRAGNVHQHLDLIAGLPFEDYESFRRSFNDVYTLQPEQLQLGFLKILKGSAMADMTEECLCRYKTREPYEVLSTRWLSYGDILRLKQVESMVELYYNSMQFTQTLPEILRLFATPFDFYQELGDYYDTQGYSEISPSRMRRYDILLEFLERVPGAPLDRIKNLLTRDLYQRENLKSRPDWMSDQSPWRKQIREYIRGNRLEKSVHIEVFPEGAVLFDYAKRNPLTNNTEGISIVL